MERVYKRKEEARLARLERAAVCLEGRCSIHLSYRGISKNQKDRRGEWI